MQNYNQNIPKSSLVLSEAITRLRDKYVALAVINTQYSDALDAKVGDSVKIRVPTVYDVYEFTGMWDPQEASQNTVQIKVEKHFRSDLAVTDTDLALTPFDFYNQHLDGMVVPLVEAAEGYCLSKIEQVYNYIDGISGAPDSRTDLARINAFTEMANIPSGQKYALISIMDKISLLDIDEVTHADVRADAGQALRSASVGSILDVEYISTKYLPKKAAIDVDNGITGSPVLAGAVSKGATTITLSGFTDGNKVQKGDIIEFADGSKVVASADATLEAGTNSDVAIHASNFDVASGEAVSKLVNVAYNVVMHPSAISFVNVQLPTADRGISSSYMIDPESGFGMRLMENQFDHTTNTYSWSLETMCGSNLTRPELIARFDGYRG